MFKNGEGQNLSYLNEEGVYSPLPLKHGDIIELGNTKLRFIQFCDENFNWKERKKNSLKMQFEQCNKCLYKDSCEWVWKEYWEIYWWDEISPII